MLWLWLVGDGNAEAGAGEGEEEVMGIGDVVILSEGRGLQVSMLRPRWRPLGEVSSAVVAGF